MGVDFLAWTALSGVMTGESVSAPVPPRPLDRFGRLPAWLRPPVALLLTLLLVTVFSAVLTDDASDRWGFTLGLVLVHVAFGFVYGSWWAATGSAIWLPLALVASGEDEPIGVILVATLVPASFATFVACGVRTRRLLLRSVCWRELERRMREPAGPLPVQASVGLGVVLAALLWAADAITRSPLVVAVVGMVALLGFHLLGSRATGRSHVPLLDLSRFATGRPWKRHAMVVVPVLAVGSLWLLFIEVGELLGVSRSHSESGPVIDSAGVWAIALLFFVIEAARRVGSNQRPRI